MRPSTAQRKTSTLKSGSEDPRKAQALDAALALLIGAKKASRERRALRLLDRTTYASITGQARQPLERGEALFALDAAVDRRYFAGLARRGNEIGDTAGQLLRAIRPVHGRPCY